MRVSLTSSLAALICSFLLPHPAVAIENGGTSLYTESVTYCSDAKAVLVNQFDIEYFVANQSVVFALSAASVEPNLNISANIYVNAYGMDLLNLTINLCDYLEGILCPLPTINFTGYGTYPLPDEYTSKIPSIAYGVPDLEAYAQIQLVSVDSGEVAACLQATLSNGWSTRTPAVAWASAGLFLAALAVALVHSTLKASPSPAVYRWYDVLHLFQVAAATGLLNLNYPSVYANFTLNFGWALGLFHNDNLRNAVNRLRGLTGGKLSDTAYPGVDYVNRKLSPYNEAIRLVNFNAVLPSGATTRDMFKSFFAQTSYDPLDSSSLARRAADIPTVSSTNANSIVKAGIPTYLNALGIPTADGFDFIFLIYLIAIAVTIGFLALFFLTVFLLDLFRREERRGTGWIGRNRRGFMSFATGNFLRLCLVFLFPILIFSFFQWTVGRGDSWLSILLSVLCVLWTIVPLIIAFVWTVIRGRQREYGEPYDVSPLFSRFRLYHSAGMIYRQFKQKRHFWWFAPLAIAYVAQAAFIGFGQNSAWAQVIGLLVIEFIVFVSYIIWRPHKDVKGDLLEIFLSFCRMAAFGLLIAFIPSVGVKAIVRTIIGFVIIVLFGIPTILLFFGLLFNLAYGYAFRRHKRRVEDGVEVRSLDAESDRSSQQPAMAQVDLAAASHSPDEASTSSQIINGGSGYAGVGVASSDAGHAYGQPTHYQPSPLAAANGPDYSAHGGFVRSPTDTTYPSEYSYPGPQHQQDPAAAQYAAAARQGGQNQFYGNEKALPHRPNGY